MKQTITKLAVKVGKEFVSVFVSAFAMAIGKLVIGGFQKGFKSFELKRAEKKLADQTASAEVVFETETTDNSVETDVVETPDESITEENL